MKLQTDRKCGEVENFMQPVPACFIVEAKGYHECLKSKPDSCKLIEKVTEVNYA